MCTVNGAARSRSLQLSFLVAAGRWQRQRRGCSLCHPTCRRIGTSIRTRRSKPARCTRCSRRRMLSPRSPYRRVSPRYPLACLRGPASPPFPCNTSNSSHACAPSPRRRPRNFKSKSVPGPISPKPTPNLRTLYHNKWQSPTTLKLPNSSSLALYVI